VSGSTLLIRKGSIIVFTQRFSWAAVEGHPPDHQPAGANK
jgi:hypothetical protein